jgi:hypothetical protein
VCHQTVSGAPGDSKLKLLTFENSQRRFAIIHRTVRCTTGQCPVLQGRATLNSPASGIRSAKIHRTVSGAHRTVRCDIGATATSHAMVDCNALNACLSAQRSRARAGGTPDSLQDLSGAPPDSQAGPQDRAPTVGTQRPGDVAGAPDSVRWGYKYPNHPHIQVIQVFHLPTTYKS